MASLLLGASDTSCAPTILVSPGEFLRKSTATLLQLLHGLKRARTIHHTGREKTPLELLRRAKFLTQTSASLLSHLGVRIQIEGTIPQRGLLVCNHVSFLDIMVLSAVHPLVFVSKSEVAHWPIVGAIAESAGTLFIQREKRSDVSRINEQIRAVFDAGLLVCIFPEGTSSDGSSVLPFKPSLLQPAITEKIPIYPGHIFYGDRTGKRIDELAYFGDRSLIGCLSAVLWMRESIARVRFGSHPPAEPDRKKMASILHAAVCSLGDDPSPACLDAPSPPK